MIFQFGDITKLVCLALHCKTRSIIIELQFNIKTTYLTKAAQILTLRVHKLLLFSCWIPQPVAFCLFYFSCVESLRSRRLLLEIRGFGRLQLGVRQLDLETQSSWLGFESRSPDILLPGRVHGSGQASSNKPNQDQPDRG